MFKSTSLSVLQAGTFDGPKECRTILSADVIDIFQALLDDGRRSGGNVDLDAIWPKLEPFELSWVHASRTIELSESAATTVSRFTKLQEALQSLRECVVHKLEVLKSDSLALPLHIGLAKLPHEVLSSILLFAGDGIRLSWVCRQFRAVALDTPQLWRHLDSRFTEAQTRSYISRSKATNLSFTLHKLESEPSREVASRVASFLRTAYACSERWSSVSVDRYNEALEKAWTTEAAWRKKRFRTMYDPFGSMVKLPLPLCPGQHDSKEELFSFKAWDATALIRFEVEIRQRPVLSLKDCMPQGSWGQLHSFELALRSPQLEETDTYRLFNVLSTMAALSEWRLDLSNLIVQQSGFTNVLDAQPGPLSFPNLHRLDIKLERFSDTYTWMDMFFGRLVAAQLESLNLELVQRSRCTDVNDRDKRRALHTALQHCEQYPAVRTFTYVGCDCDFSIDHAIPYILDNMPNIEQLRVHLPRSSGNIPSVLWTTPDHCRLQILQLENSYGAWGSYAFNWLKGWILQLKGGQGWQGFKQLSMLKGPHNQYGPAWSEQQEAELRELLGEKVLIVE